jgi:ribonuclease HII
MQRSQWTTTLADYDDELRRCHGVELIGGVDEAGRGALAGPVVSAAVVLGPGAVLPGVNDSKALRPAHREAMVPLILARARAFGLGMATAEEIDEINILQATHLAAARALAGLSLRPELLVTDYLKLRDAPAPVLAIKKGDATSLAVAAASVLAKVARDRLMTRLDAEFPQFGFARHKGYGTASHLAALRSVGASSVHRLTFAGVCWFGEEALRAARKVTPETGLLALLEPDSVREVPDPSPPGIGNGIKS